MFAFKIFEKIQFFCLFASNIWQLSVIFKKSASLLTVTIFETLFWSGLLARITTNHKHHKSHSSLLCGENVLAKNAFFQNFKKYDFLHFTSNLLPKAFWEYTIRKKAKNPKKVNIFDKSFVNFLWNFCQYFKLPWLFTRKLVVFCKTLMSTCSASFRFFRYMEMVVWAFEDEKW